MLEVSSWNQQTQQYIGGNAKIINSTFDGNYVNSKSTYMGSAWAEPSVMEDTTRPLQRHLFLILSFQTVGYYKMVNPIIAMIKTLHMEKSLERGQITLRSTLITVTFKEALVKAGQATKFTI